MTTVDECYISVFFYVFCFSWVLYYFLFGFLYIFKCFWSQTSQGTRGSHVLLAGSVAPYTVAPCTACRISLLQRPFRIVRKLALTCLNTQITLQYKPYKRATKLIVMILTDINACNHKISINKKRGGRITSSGADFYWFFKLSHCFRFFRFFLFFVCFLFFLGTLLLFVWFLINL